MRAQEAALWLRLLCHSWWFFAIDLLFDELVVHRLFGCVCGVPEAADSEFEGEEARTAWGRKAEDFYGGSSGEDSSDDDEALQLRVSEAVRVTEVEDAVGMKDEHFGAEPRLLEGLRKLLDSQGKAPLADEATQEKQEGQDGQQVLWKARLDAVGLQTHAKV